MFDRQLALSLAKEWAPAATADWIESVDTGRYGRMIVQGPKIIEDDLSNQKGERYVTRTAIGNDADYGTNDIDVLMQVREDMHTMFIA